MQSISKHCRALQRIAEHWAATRAEWKVAVVTWERGCLAPPSAPTSFRRVLYVTSLTQLPTLDVNPAMALPCIISGLSSMLTPVLSADSHSARWSARTLLWLPTRDAEHAVSNDAHGPCRPSANDTRPHVTEHAKPVAAYTLRPRCVSRITL